MRKMYSLMAGILLLIMFSCWSFAYSAYTVFSCNGTVVHGIFALTCIENAE